MKVHDWKGQQYQKKLFVVSLNTWLIKERSLKESPRMSFYKGLAYLVYLESLRVMHSNNGEIWKALFIYHWSGARLDPFHEWKDHSASAILIGRVHAMRRRRWMFGKASLSHAPSASRRLLGSSFSADCHIICHLRSSFQRDLGNGRSFSQNNMPSVASDSFRVLLTMIEGTR